MAPTTFADRKDTYEAALTSLFRGKPEDTETDLGKLFTADFKFRADGEAELDFNGFVAHMRRLRQMKLDVNINTVQFLRDGNQLAERHSSTTKVSDGDIRPAETFQFAEVADDGRLAWIVEVVQRG